MELIHQELLHSGRLTEVQRPHSVATIQFATPATTYPRFGVSARLSSDTHNALHALAVRECGEDESVPTAFMNLVQRVESSKRVRGSRSVDLIHFLGLAAHYGIHLTSLDDLIEVVTALHDLIAPGISTHGKSQQRRDYWLHIGNLLALLGGHAGDPLVAEELEEGVSARAIIDAALFVAKIRQALPGNKLLALSIHSKMMGLEVLKIAQLINHHPERVDDLIELMRRGLLTPEAADEFLAQPELLAALCLRAIDELIHLTDKGRSLLDTARQLAGDLRDTNMMAELELAQVDMDEEEVEAEEEEEPEPEQEQAPSFDHTRLDIAEAVGTRSGNVLEAMQILLVHGVIQPENTVSNMINGSKIPREELDDLCRPHLMRALVSEQSLEQAIGFLTTVKVLGTEVKGGRKRGHKKLRSRRIWFNKTLNSIPRGKAIIDAVLALNAEVRG